MRTKDITLQQFILAYNIGQMTSCDSEILNALGNTNENLSVTELLLYSLSREFEVGELPAIATSYLIRSGYKEVVAIDSRSIEGPLNLDEEPGETDSNVQKFDHSSLISAEDGDPEQIKIIVSYNREACVFIKLSI